MFEFINDNTKYATTARTTTRKRYTIIADVNMLFHTVTFIFVLPMIKLEYYIV